MRKILYFLIMIFLLNSHPISAQIARNDRNEGALTYEAYESNQSRWADPLSKTDRAVGISDRGQLSNVVGNFGIISNFHLFAPALHWPGYADDRHQYSFGLNMLIGSDGDVISSTFDPSTVAESYDWEAKDGSLGDLHSGDVTVSDGTPVLASSDNAQTWPLDQNGSAFWPGSFRLDPDTDEQVPGEFVSERDIYSVFTDQENITGARGLEVRQNTYSFSRSYAEDFLIFDYQIVNTGDVPLDSIWIGYLADFKVDYDNSDLIRFTNSEGNPPQRKDLVYLWDSNPNSGNWDVTGYIGLLMLATPRNRGITDFHYFDNIYEPATDDQIWEIMTSDTSGSHITASNYFHGENHRLDDDALAPDMDPDGDGLGTDFVFIISTGSIDLAPGDSVHTAFAIVMGESESELLANVGIVKSMAAQSYLGPNAPVSPSVQAFPGDKRTTIVWDGSASENSRDLLTGLMDFEGYRIYRSQDRGRSWGTSVTDVFGNPVGFVPIAQFDLDNDISGMDPNSNFYLGNNTGLRHTFIDSTVLNGVEYWYTVTAYDRGDIETGILALESRRGVTTDEAHTVSVIPSAPFPDYAPLPIAFGDSLSSLGLPCDSRVSVQVIDEGQLTGDRYQVAFRDLGLVVTPDDEGFPDSALTATFDLINLSTGDTLLRNCPPLNNTQDNVPVTEGFRIMAQETESGAAFADWTLQHGEPTTYEWRMTNFEQAVDNTSVGPDGMDGSHDFRVTVDYDAGNEVEWYDLFFGEIVPDTTMHIPLKIELITDPDHPIDISSQSQLMEYDLFGSFPNRDIYFSPFGWDLEPGGTGYNPNTPVFSYLWPDIIAPRYIVTDPITGLEREYLALLITQNYPDSYTDQYGNPVDQPAIPPQQGDQFTIIAKKLFRTGVYYEFETHAPDYNQMKTDLNRIKVVPNPYIVRAGWETDSNQGRLQFTGLPPQCDIAIYTVAGDHLVTLHHDGQTDYEFWDLQNSSNVNVAYGLYVYVVKTDGGEDHIGRFAVIR